MPIPRRHGWAGGSLAARVNAAAYGARNASIVALAVTASSSTFPSILLSPSSIAFLILIFVEVLKRRANFEYTPIFAMLWLFSLGITAINIGNLAKMLTLNAQVSAREFYEKAGYQAGGAIFDDAGIPHVPMDRPA